MPPALTRPSGPVVLQLARDERSGVLEVPAADRKAWLSREPAG